MGTKTGEFRETLLEAIHAVKAGRLESEGAKAIAMLAREINASLAIEIRAGALGLLPISKKNSLPLLGATALGEENLIEGSK